MISLLVIFDVSVRVYYHGAKKFWIVTKKLAADTRKVFRNGQLFF